MKRGLLACGLWAWASVAITAQELEPRAYAAAPVGLNFLVVAAGRSTGGVLVDPSLPIEDVQASVDSLALGIGKTLNVFGRTGLAVVAVPFAWVSASGLVADTPGHVSRTGLADPRLKLSVNLVGGRALSPREFARASRSTIVGVSLTMLPPVGQYNRTRLVNIGSNRWSFKPEVGVSHAIARWTIEGYAGVWLFTTNDQFYRGVSIRTQDPIVALQTHVSYTLRPRLWFSGDATWYSGGTTTVDGVLKADLQRNSRIGATMSLALSRQQSFKISGSTGATTRVGSDFRTLAVAWQLAWFDRPRNESPQ
ncbi:MAG TPA: transporter [Vicinamibacterales bacterium]|nr:transporter [Vicinamibacterales bacterium]